MVPMGETCDECSSASKTTDLMLFWGFAWWYFMKSVWKFVNEVTKVMMFDTQVILTCWLVSNIMKNWWNELNIFFWPQRYMVSHIFANQIKFLQFWSNSRVSSAVKLALFLITYNLQCSVTLCCVKTMLTNCMTLFSISLMLFNRVFSVRNFSLVSYTWINT